MNLFKAKLNAVLMSALVASLLILVGLTTTQAMSVDSSIAPSAYLEHSNLAEVVPSMPNAAELRLSPSYYRDDVAKIDGTAAPVASELRFSPSYYRDDAAMVGFAASAPVASVQRFSPSYHQDDPIVIKATQPASVVVDQQWGPTYHRDDPGLVNGGASQSLPGRK